MKDAPLTPRETEVIELLCEGLTNEQIGKRLHLSPHTAKFHLNNIFWKTDALTRTELVAWWIAKKAYERGYEDGKHARGKYEPKPDDRFCTQQGCSP